MRKTLNIKYICCDIEKGFQSSIVIEFSGAIVICDCFHVIEHMIKVVDRTRRSEDGRLNEAIDLKG